MKRLAPLLLVVASAGYICRVAPTIAGPGIMADFGLSQTQLGTVFSAFLLGYTLCQVPSGWLADRVHPRRLFLAMSGAWAALTAATAVMTPAAGGLAGLWVVRLLFGVTAAPTYPASARTIGVHLPPRVQGTANGIVFASIGIGSALTPLALGAATRVWGWRTALWMAAGTAAAAALLWGWLCPRGVHTAAPAQGSALAAPGLRSRTYWLLVASYTLQGYVGYIFVFWFYLYLVQVRRFEVMQAAAVTALPWLCTLVAIPAGGALSDAAVRRAGPTWGRRLIPLPALVLAAVFLVVGARTESAWLAVACLTACTVLVIGTEGPFWATLNQVAGRHGGLAGGIMNFGSNLGGLISPVATPWLAARIGWAGALTVAAVLAAVAGALWIGVSAGAGRDATSLTTTESSTA